MATEFDTTLKTLVDGSVAEWVAFLTARVGLPAGPGSLLDTDLSATLQADRLIRVDGPEPFALHLEFQSSNRLGVPARMLRYNVAASAANELPVASVLVLLRPSAAASDQDGVLEVAAADAAPHLTFRYAVLRVWQERMDTFLRAGPGLVPLAVLTNEAAADTTTAFGRVGRRLREPDIPGSLASVLAGLTAVLCGMRYDDDIVREAERMIEDLLQDSRTFQRWQREGEARGEARGKAEGEAEEARRLLTRLGTRRFGPPPATTEAAIAAEADRDRLERMADRLLDAAGWDDLLSTP